MSSVSYGSVLFFGKTVTAAATVAAAAAVVCRLALCASPRLGPYVRRPHAFFIDFTRARRTNGKLFMRS